MAEFTRRVELIITAKDEASAILDAVAAKAKAIAAAAGGMGGGKGGGGRGGATSQLKLDQENSRKLFEIAIKKQAVELDHLRKMGALGAKVAQDGRKADQEHARKMTEIAFKRSKAIDDATNKRRQIDAQAEARMARVTAGGGGRAGGAGGGGRGGSTAGSKGGISGGAGGGMLGLISNAPGILGAVAGMGEKVLGIFGMFGSVLDSLAAKLADTFSVKNLIAVSSAFEQNQVALAGTMQALGFASDYEGGLKAADAALTDIIAKAAVLPGEAEQYIEVFRAGLPQMQYAIGNNTAAITEFSNRFSAVAIMMGVNEKQAGRDLQKILAVGAGRAGAATRSFSLLLPFMRKIQGQAQLTAQSFNRMSEAKRFEILNKALLMQGDALKASANTWDAMAGGFTSAMKMLVRLGGAELFDGIKASLGFVNGLLVDENGKLQAVGQTIVDVGKAISSAIGGALRDAFGMAAKMHERFQAIARTVAGSHFRNALKYAHDRTVGVGGDIVQHHLGTAAGMGGGAAAAAGTAVAGASVVAAVAAVAAPEVVAGVAAAFLPLIVIAGLVGMALVEFSTRTSAVIETGASLARTFGNAMTVVDPLLNYFGALQAILGDVAEVLIPFFATSLEELSVPIFAVAGYLFDLAGTVLSAVRPALLEMWQAIVQAGNEITSALIPIMQLFGADMTNTASVLSSVLTVAVIGAAGAIKTFASAVAAVLNFLRKFIPNIPAIALGGMGADEGGGGGTASGMATYNAMNLPSAGPVGGAKAKGAPGGRGGTTQDFRYSRFEITQKYAEGYDPDRILLAFTNDLQRVGESKLQSGYERGIPLR
jgi:hypothetical protein